MRRFLHHVVPKGFVKVRYFSLFSPGKRRLLAHLRQVLALTTGVAAPAACRRRHRRHRPVHRCAQCVGTPCRWCTCSSVGAVLHQTQ
jgi:hypothetical protein